MATAGKAVFFSGATVLIGLLGLSLFEFMFLRSVGIAGVIVVAWSTIAAVTLLPALLAIVGTNIDRFSIRRRTHRRRRRGFWVRLSRAVMARPFAVLIPTLAFLLLLGTPFLRANISSPDATILPRDLPSRQAFDLLVTEYGAGEIAPFFIVLESPGDLFTPERLGAVYDVGARLADDPRVTRVQTIVPPTMPRDAAIGAAFLQRGLDRLGVETGVGRLANENVAVIVAYTSFLPNSAESKALLAELRSLKPPGLTVMVDGGTAEIVDVVAEMYAEFPRAIAFVVGATYVVLLLLFRSVLLPLKAILMNGLSIVASYGALVWVFQEGNLSGLLGFTGLGFVEASLPVIMFCVLFGLSMDYEVFLLSRIREEWERTGDNARAVAVGLQRSGRIITSAALIVVVVAGAFVTADVVLIKALGFGIALAVFLDATVVRALLVPSTMRLLGRGTGGCRLRCIGYCRKDRSWRSRVTRLADPGARVWRPALLACFALVPSLLPVGARLGRDPGPGCANSGGVSARRWATRFGHRMVVLHRPSLHRGSGSATASSTSSFAPGMAISRGTSRTSR